MGRGPWWYDAMPFESSSLFLLYLSSDGDWPKTNTVSSRTKIIIIPTEYTQNNTIQYNETTLRSNNTKQHYKTITLRTALKHYETTQRTEHYEPRYWISTTAKKQFKQDYYYLTCNNNIMKHAFFLKLLLPTTTFSNVYYSKNTTEQCEHYRTKSQHPPAHFCNPLLTYFDPQHCNKTYWLTHLTHSLQLSTPNVYEPPTDCTPSATAKWGLNQSNCLQPQTLWTNSDSWTPS